MEAKDVQNLLVFLNRVQTNGVQEASELVRLYTILQQDLPKTTKATEDNSVKEAEARG